MVAASGVVDHGLGCAANVWGGGGNRQTRAMCEINPDGSVVNKIGTQDIGTGTRTLVAMITAETMGLPLNAVTAAIGDTDYPFAPGSGGGVTVGSISPTVRVSAETRSGCSSSGSRPSSVSPPISSKQGTAGSR